MREGWAEGPNDHNMQVSRPISTVCKEAFILAINLVTPPFDNRAASLLSTRLRIEANELRESGTLLQIHVAGQQTWVLRDAHQAAPVVITKPNFMIAPTKQYSAAFGQGPRLLWVYWSE